MPTHIVPPEKYPRRVLLAVTGLSPQIVTETLYALAVERCWIPTEVRVITTLQGAEEIGLACCPMIPAGSTGCRGLPAARDRV